MCQRVFIYVYSPFCMLETSIDKVFPVITLDFCSLEYFADSLTWKLLPAFSFSTFDEAYRGNLEHSGIYTRQYPLIIAPVYSKRDLRDLQRTNLISEEAIPESSIPEGILFAQLLRKEQNPNNKTPLFLVHYTCLEPSLVATTEQDPKGEGGPALSRIIHPTIPLTYFYNLENKEDWDMLIEESIYLAHHFHN